MQNIAALLLVSFAWISLACRVKNRQPTEKHFREVIAFRADNSFVSSYREERSDPIGSTLIAIVVRSMIVIYE